MQPYSYEYFYSASLLIGAVVNILLAFMLTVGAGRREYAAVPAYRRSRYLTSASLMVFAVGFLLHWWFNPRAVNPVLATALSVSYFHVGGMLLSMSHTYLLHPGRLPRKLLLRDVGLTTLTLSLYAACALTNSRMVLYVALVLTTVHLVLLSSLFYRRFQNSYALLGCLAEFRHVDHQIDRNIRWLYFSCHLLIAFGIGGVLFTAGGYNDVADAGWMVRVIILMGFAVVVFGYAYFSLTEFGSVVLVAQQDMNEAVAFAAADEGRECFEAYLAERNHLSPLGRFSFLTGFFRQW